MAEKKKHKKRKQHIKNKPAAKQSQSTDQEQPSSEAQQKSARVKRKDDAKSSTKTVKKSSKKKAKKGKDGKPAKPSIWRRFLDYCKGVKSEMQRVVWPTRKELLNASLIVIGAIIFFGVLIAIIDNIVVIPLDWIASLGA